MPAKKIGFGSGCFFQAFSPQKTASQTGGSRYSPAHAVLLRAGLKGPW